MTKFVPLAPECADKDRLAVLSAHLAPEEPRSLTLRSVVAGYVMQNSVRARPLQMLRIQHGQNIVSDTTNGSRAPIVIGGMVMDVLAVPGSQKALAPGTTVPGTIKQSAGGVGRNIAQCIASLTSGAFRPPLLISVVGKDSAGDALIGHLRQLGIPDRGVRRSSTSGTASVAVVFGCTGEVEAAVADVGILDDEYEAKLQTSWIQGFAKEISSSPLMIVDANLHEDTLRTAVEMAAGSGVPVWFEPVSVTKSKRAASIFDKITVVSPNQNELRAMAEATGQCHFRSSENLETSAANKSDLSPEQELRTLIPFAKAILNAGVKYLVLTLGSNGAAILTRKSASDTAVVTYHVPALPSRVVGLTGAGDSLVAGCVSGLLRGEDLAQSMHRGIAAASIVIQSPENVPASLTDALVVAAGKQNGKWLAFT